jgi:hypothetical protein
MKIKYSFTHSNGTISTRTSERTYTHAVERLSADGREEILSWHGSYDLAVKSCASWNSKHLDASKNGTHFPMPELKVVEVK